MPKDPENNPLDLIALSGKPKRWRLHATRILIKHNHRLKILQLEIGALIGLSMLILGVLVKLALG